jgi:chromate reductase
MSIHVLGFSGSLRAGSYNTALLHTARELAPQGMEIETFDLSGIPLYNGDVEKQGMPPAVAAFRERLAAADALLIATPEYNFSVSGVLKNAIDWASRSPDSPLTDKPLAMMGAGGRFGTLRAQLHLRDIVMHNNMQPLNNPQVTIARAWEHFDDEGRLTDERSRKAVRDLLAGLYDWTLRLRTTGQAERTDGQRAVNA